MHREYLGDSYDLVKRFFAQVLSQVAPLYAHPGFVPEEIQEHFTDLTSIRILREGQDGDFGILLDPDTGIPLDPGRPCTRKHAPIDFVVEATRKATYLICFDQSHHRKHALDPKGQRAWKREQLRKNGIPSFYYESHAPFLFAARDGRTLKELRKRLIHAGIPECRFETKAAPLLPPLPSSHVHPSQ
jgi:hypothetical protein